MTRGTGKTFGAIRTAPPDAIYVWPHESLSYPHRIAKYLRRSDLLIVKTEDLDRAIRGENRPLVFDHDATMEKVPEADRAYVAVHVQTYGGKLP